MVFSSYLFIFLFLPASLLLYYSLYKAPQRARNLCLVLLGYIFYGWSNPQFVGLMAGTTLIDWTMGLVIARGSWRVWSQRATPIEPLAPGTRSKTQRTAILISIIANLTVLGFFKYFNFAVDSYNGVMGSLGLTHAQWDGFFRIVLPLGISFYTFQALSYIIDVYRGDAKAMGNLIDFACFISMFPHLVAGPILKFSFLAEQLTNRTHTLEKFTRGLVFFSLGLAKKVLLANPCGKIADITFQAASVHPFDAWFGAVAYAFQIFFDFSGYSDMAIGLGLMLGFVFAKNFDAPYRAESMTEFWQRWHISLSTWLREYLYIPLGGNRQGSRRTYFNLFVTMLLGGLWHGASWNFVIWGGIHGCLLAIERSRRRRSLYSQLPKTVRVAFTFVLIVITWVFFRAIDLPRALGYLMAMMGLRHASANADLVSGILYTPYSVLAFAAAAVIVWAGPRSWEWTRHLTWAKGALCMILLWGSLVMLATQSYNPFIYFRF